MLERILGQETVRTIMQTYTINFKEPQARKAELLLPLKTKEKNTHHKNVA